MMRTRSSPTTRATGTTTPTTGAPDLPAAAAGGAPLLDGPEARPFTGAPESARPLLYATAIAAGLAVGLGVWYLSVGLEQAPHRIFKLLLGGLGVALFLCFPRVTPFILLLGLPFVDWLPKSPIPFLNTMNIIVGLSLVNMLVLRAGARERREGFPAVSKVVLVFVGAVVFSFIRGWLLPPPGTTYAAGFLSRELWTVTAAFFTFFPLYYFLDSPRMIRRAMFVYAVALALGALGCISQSQGSREGYRIGGGVGDVNDLGAFYAESLVFFLPVLTRRGALPARVRLAMIPLLGLSVMGLLLPNSRGALIGFGVSGLVYFGAMRPKLLVPYVVALALGWSIMPTTVKERLSGTYTSVVASGVDYEALNVESETRLDIWKASIKVARENPLIGVGYANLPTLIREEIKASRNSHNVYLQIWGEGGFIGLATLVALIVAVLRLGLRVRRNEDAFTRAVGEGTILMVVCLIVVNLFGDRFLQFALEALLMFVAAASARMLALSSAPAAPAS